ncbi:MAG: tRNA (cytidine(34)-2'-O)-methyltransferase [Pirellulales bacterium]|nr:tRNA (cytidine(34)-2'-O)-methyltransferase [Pirellulales bacterium]
MNVVLHQPEIPDNTGSIGRTCVATGAKLWLIRPLGFQIDNARIRRAGMDYWNHLEWEVVNDWAALKAQLAESRMWLFSKTATREYTDVEYAAGDTLVFGCESQGLPRTLLDEHPQQCLRIPIESEARSLNLSVAVAVAVYEARRQGAIHSR